MKPFYYLFELYTDMPTNEISDMRKAGDFIKVKYTDMPVLIHELLVQGVQFSVDEIGNCVGDYSYNYEFRGTNEPSN